MDARSIRRAVEEGNALKSEFFGKNAAAVLAAGDAFVRCLRAGGKLLFFGNGGSAAEAQHVADEYVNRMTFDRPALAALALTTDTSNLTAIANDSDFTKVFSRQIEALGRPGDVAVGISTSGRSENVIQGMRAARRGGLVTVALLGRDGGPIRSLADHPLVVESADTQRIQEVHLVIEHVLCEHVESTLFPRGRRTAQRRGASTRRSIRRTTGSKSAGTR